MSSKRNLNRKHVFVNKAHSCFGKIKYLDRDAAEEAVWSLSRDPVFHGGRLNVYFCNSCCRYHVGHMIRYDFDTRKVVSLNAKSKEN
jgi:hypothetical protein